LDIGPSQSPYVIIPCTYTPQQESTFELNFASETNQDFNLEICSDPWSYTSLPGKWTKGTAGGCPEDSTFGNNPQFQLKILKPCDLQIVLTQPSSKSMKIIGFYIFKTALGKVSSVGDCEVLAVGEFVDIEEGRSFLLSCDSSLPHPSMILSHSYAHSITHSHTLTHITVSARFRVAEMGMYTVVPCTLNSGEEGDFELTVFASLPSCDVFIKLLAL
jgi:hypothetical protein